MLIIIYILSDLVDPTEENFFHIYKWHICPLIYTENVTSKISIMLRI